MGHQFLFPVDDFAIIQEEGSTIRYFQARNDAQQRRFTAAGRTNQGEGVNLIQVEIDILQDDLSTERLGQIRRSKSHIGSASRAIESKA